LAPVGVGWGRARLGEEKQKGRYRKGHFRAWL
jgi:hypothetical protein